MPRLKKKFLLISVDVKLAHNRAGESVVTHLLCLTDHPAVPRVLLLRGGPVHRVPALSGQRALQPPRTAGRGARCAQEVHLQ